MRLRCAFPRVTGEKQCLRYEEPMFEFPSAVKQHCISAFRARKKQCNPLQQFLPSQQLPPSQQFIPRINPSLEGCRDSRSRQRGFGSTCCQTHSKIREVANSTLPVTIARRPSGFPWNRPCDSPTHLPTPPHSPVLALPFTHPLPWGEVSAKRDGCGEGWVGGASISQEEGVARGVCVGGR